MSGPRGKGYNPSGIVDRDHLSPGTARILTALCAAATLAVFCLPISNLDLFRHLSAARWMTEHLPFPRSDWLSWTMAAEPWVDFEWLTQILYHGVATLGGSSGLWLLKVVLLGLGAALMWLMLRLYGLGPAGRSLAVWIWALGMIPSNDLRPESLSVPLWAVLFGSWAVVLSRWRGRRDVPLEHLAALAVFGLLAAQ